MKLGTTDYLKEIQYHSYSMQEEIIAIRRTFHQYPELSWEEYKTAARITELLKEEKMEMKTGICGTGVIANINGSGDGKTVAIRADMDALPMYDAKEVPYASKITGILHACGHDAHMAISIGVAKVLNKLNIDLPGNVRFIFQPSEEATPSGAERLVNEGVLEGVDAVLAFHVDPEISAGQIGLRAGVLTANCNEFKIKILGKSGHAARPHQSIDTIFLSSQVLNALYEIVQSRSQLFMPAVLSIGKIDGGTKANVIPEKVEIAGTVRTVDDQSMSEMLSAIEEHVHSITRAAGGTYQLEFLRPVPSVINDHGLTNLVRDVVGELLEQDDIINIKNISMGGEDFSWYLKEVPGVLIRLGVRNRSQEVRYLHTHKFDIDESAIPLGITIMSMVVLKFLSG